VTPITKGSRDYANNISDLIDGIKLMAQIGKLFKMQECTNRVALKGMKRRRRISILRLPLGETNRR